jgi:zinc/manganese transport system permease protein
VRFVFEPGFFSSQPVHVALVVGAITAIVSAVVGVFTVLRGQSFAGHSLADVSTAGGSGAILAGMSPLTGFIGGGLIGAVAMDLLGIRRVRGRDLATGIVLGASIGLAALFLYLDTTSGAVTGSTQQILFGSIFTVDTSTVPVVVIFSSVCLAVMAVIYRPLLLSSMSSDVAAARGVPLRLVGLAFVMALALAVGLSALSIGAILSTALLIGPAAAALRVTRRVGAALAVACVVGVAATWLGVLLAYDSYYWSSSHRGLPVSFFIVAVAFLSYLASGLPVFRGVAGRRRQSAGPGDGG